MQRTTKSVLCILSLVIAIGLWLKATVIQVPSGTWAPAGSMAEARSGAASVLLQDGTILVTGGEGASGVLSSAEFFSAGSFAAAPAMNVTRKRHTAVVLQDGRVLVAGGKTTGDGVTNAAEVYSPALNSWIVIASMADARSGHTATLLKDGRVLLTGGEGSAGARSTLEVFDPVAGTFTFVGTMSSGRKDHAAALLLDGRALIAGGSDGANALASTEIYDPETGVVVAGPVLSIPRAGLSATTLMDGNVLIAGGNNGTTDLATAEVFNSTTGVVSPLGSSLATARRDHSAFLLPNNNHVLIVGGTSSGTAPVTAELFRRWDGNFHPTGSMSTARTGFSGAALGLDGVLLVAGGSGLAGSELYGFATVKTDKDDYRPGALVTMTGSGWQPGEVVNLLLHEINNPDPHDDLTLIATADPSGGIFNNQFAPDEHDLGVRFYLTATGQSSGRSAQITFTDDQVVNGIDTTIDGTLETATITSGGSVSVSFFIQPSNVIPAGDASGCNSTGASPATVTLSVPAGVTASATSLIFAGCGLNQSVNFSSSTPNTYTISVLSVTGGKVGSLWDTAAASFQLIVNPPANTAPTLAVIGNKTLNEGNLLSFIATATDPDSGQTLTFSLDAGAPAGAAITSAGAFTWTPTEAQGPGDYSVTIRVTDSGTPALSDTETISIDVNEVNAAPELAAIGNRTVDEETQLSFTATATDSDVPANTLTFSLDAGAPAGASITSAGAFTWTPTEAQGPGDYSVTIRVTDNGTPALNDFETISIHVNEVNAAPELAAIGNKTIDEETQLSFTATATDADLPANTLTFSLDAGAPAGASITSAGAFAWTPTEAQGPGDYSVTIRVTDNGTPALNDFETISIHVNEVNKAPELAGIGNKSVLWGNVLSFTASATDPDLPANVLTFSLVGAPAGAGISGAGAFSWTPTSGQIGSHTFTVKVVDNGSPSFSDQETITVVVGQRPTLLVYSGDSSGQYSDSVGLRATLRDNGGGVMQGNGISGKTVSFMLGSQSANDDTDSTGLASANLTLTQAADSYSVNSSFTGDLLYLSSSDSDPFTINHENGQIQYTGVDTVAQVGATITLRATVWDSASNGYTGANPENGVGATIGDTTKMWIAFDIYSAGSCGSGVPLTTKYGQVIDTGTAGDGIGTATQTFTSSSENSYCVVAALVANGSGGTPNLFYAADPAQPTGLAFYNNTGQFVTAGGWIYDSNPSRGNFGLNARNNKNGQAQGQMVYVYRGLYNGVPANYIIKSNSLTNFGISSGAGGTYPMTATLQGKCNLQINRASDGAVLYGEGNATFSATVIDTNQNSGSGSESYAVTVYNKDAVLYKQVAQSFLQGGNVVVHIK